MQVDLNLNEIEHIVRCVQSARAPLSLLPSHTSTLSKMLLVNDAARAIAGAQYIKSEATHAA